MRDPLREAERWLGQAQEELDLGRLVIERSPAYSCFFAHQAAEKALKAILYAAGERIVLGHGLAKLGVGVSKESPGYVPLHERVLKLDLYYIPTRYPNGLPEETEPRLAFDRDDATKALETAAEAIEYARAFIEERRARET